MPSRNDQRRVEAALRDVALAYPEAYEEFPWGHRAIKVKGKTFVFISVDGDSLSLSAKLPDTGLTALMLPFAEPTHYGLGKSGWVTASFTRAQEVPVELLVGWVDESYRAIAPTKLVSRLAAAAPQETPSAPGSKRTAR